MFQKVRDVMYTLTSGLVVAQYLSNIIGVVPIVVGRWIIQDDPFPLPVGLHTWQVRCPFINMLALAFLNLFLCGLNAELPTQVFGFATIGVWCDHFLGLQHFLGSLQGAMEPSISYLWTTAGITLCLLVGRFHLLTVRIAVTPCWFDLGVLSIDTIYWSIWIQLLRSCCLRALPRS